MLEGYKQGWQSRFNIPIKYLLCGLRITKGYLDVVTGLHSASHRKPSHSHSSSKYELWKIINMCKNSLILCILLIDEDEIEAIK